MFDPEELKIEVWPTSERGGMRVALTSIGVSVMHIPTQIGVVVNSERSQHANKEKALELLAKLVAPQPKKEPDVVVSTGKGPGYVATICRVIQDTACSRARAKEAVDKYWPDHNSHSKAVLDILWHNIP